jgi:hypothetical protein
MYYIICIFLFQIFFLIEEKDVQTDVYGRVVEYVDVPKALGDVFEALVGKGFII